MRRPKARKRSVSSGYDPEPLRVLHVSTPMSWRGGEQQLSYLFQGLDEEGVQQCVLGPKGSALERHCHERGWPFVAFSTKGPLALGVSWVLKGLVGTYGPDLVHVHDAHAHTAAYMATILFRVRVPIIVHRRVDFPVGKSFFSRQKFDHPRVARVVAVSEAIRRIGMEGVHRKGKWVTVRSGIDPERVRARKDPERLRKELEAPSELPIIGNVAALADHKDHSTFLRVARSFLDGGKKGVFVIIGEGPEREKVEEERKRLGLQEDVHLLGFREDALELMSGFDVFLMSSKTEGLGTSLLDAMAASIPIVSSNAGGIPEIIEDGKNGILGEVGDPHGLAKGVEKLLKERELREWIVRNGLGTAEEHDLRNMSSALYKIYSAVLEGRQG